MRKFGFLNHIILLVFLLLPSIVRSDVVPKVLILHSYEHGNGWTERIMDGMVSVLKSTDYKVRIYTEYLDARRFPKKDTWPAFENYLKAKYSGEKFNVILASDDDILDFLIPRYKNLFPGIPFVFCGINNLHEKRFKNHKLFKGVNQEVDAKRVVELALKLLPHTEQFLVISDRTSGGIKNTEKFKKDIKELGLSEQNFKIIDDVTINELKKHLQALGPNDVVLVLRIQKIKGIEERDPVRFSKIVTDTASVPVFNLWDSGKNDFIGGVQVSPFEQGKKAAEIGLKILKGVQNIPKVSESPNISVLNYVVLKKFKISEKNIPQGTTVINRPVPTLKKYRQQIRLILIISLILFLIIISLVIIIFHRRKSEKLISMSNQRYQNLFDKAPVSLWEEDFTEVFNSLEELKHKGIVNFRDFFDKNPSQVKLIAQKIKIIDVNNETLKLHGAESKDELIRNMDKIFTERSFTAIKEELISLAAGEEGFEVEGEVSSLDGILKQIHLKLILDKSNKENAIALLSTLDITKRKKAEKDKMSLQKRLVQAQKMESIGQLAGGIAHDFNNILHPILGFTQIVMDDLPETHKAQEDLKNILRSAKRARDLIKRILLFSRQKEQVFEPYLLKPLIKDTLKLLRSSIPANINIQQDLYDGEDYVLCDPTEIHEIIMNLFTNAYHAIEDNEGMLKIELNKSDPPDSLNLPSGNYICLSVSDNGVGIPSDKVDKIFDPYYTTKDIGKGTGLGLSVIHGIVKKYKGDILVVSDPGKETIFKIFLPTTDQYNHNIQQQNHKPLDGNERILFIDDEAVIIELGIKVLEKYGYKVTGKQLPSEALSLFSSKPNDFDLVITDMAMPGMVGTKIAKKILEIRPDIPIIICSGYSEKLDTLEKKRLNIKGFIDKPILLEDLLLKVREALDG